MSSNTISLTPSKGIAQGADFTITYTLDVDAPKGDVHLYIQGPNDDKAKDRTGTDLSKSQNSDGDYEFSYVQTCDTAGTWQVDAELDSTAHGKDSKHAKFFVHGDNVNKP